MPIHSTFLVRFYIHRSLGHLISLMIILMLSACGSGGGDSGDPVVPDPVISIADTSLTEGDTGTAILSFTISLDKASTGNITVDYATSDDLATDGIDYQANSGTVSINAGVTSANIDILIYGDTDVESDETLALTLSNPVGATLGNGSATGTILNDDITSPVPVSGISIADSSVAEGDSGTTNLIFTVSLSIASTAQVSVDYSASDDSAVSPADYAATSGTLDIPAGNTSAEITITVNGDTDVEMDENLTLTLSNPVGAVLGDGIATGTIVNDDSAPPVIVPVISIADSSVAEGDSDTTNLIFTVSLSEATAAEVSVDYGTSDDSAVSPADYTAASGTLVIPAGNTSANITVTVNGDTDVETDETLTLTFSNPSGATLGDSSAIGTIINDEAEISITNARIDEGDAGSQSLNFTITLSKVLASNLDVNYSTGTGSATAGVDYEAASGVATITAGNTQATIAVTIYGDTTIEQNELFPITLSNPTVGVILSQSVAYGFIDNDDSGATAPPAKTGQTVCYDSSGNFRDCAGTGEDGEHQAGVAVPSARFTDNGDGTATDELTGLMWPVQAAVMQTRDPGFDQDDVADDGIVTWQHALDYVAKLNSETYLGYNDWRLPNRLELLSLSQYQVGVPYSYFITQGLSYYGNTFWTSSTWYDNTLAGSYAWAVNLNSGYITIAEKTDLLAVQSQVVPVRGDSSGAPAPVPQTGSTHCYNTSGAQVTCSGTGQDGEYQAGVTLPNPRFTTNVDTTVTDNLTGLVWAPDANLVVSRDPTYDANGLMNWQKALDYIAKLNNESYLGYTDWRMPNVIEIQTLVNIGNAISNAAEFSNIQGIYWSSSTNYSGFQSYAWTTQIGPATLLYGGSNPTVHKDLFEYYVWPVR